MDTANQNTVQPTIRFKKNQKLHVRVPAPSPKRFYGHGIPGIDTEKLIGKLVVVEGADGSGRSSQIARLVEWLEGSGHATVQVGLKLSNLVSAELEKAKQGNILSRSTLSLFYATDFADQLENTMIPALKAGAMVLADRYIYTLMARDMVRGMDEAWLKNLYGNRVGARCRFLSQRVARTAGQRNFAKHSALDYWESGIDLGLSRDWFDSFLTYQTLITEKFRHLQSLYGFTSVNGNQSGDAINTELRKRIEALMLGKDHSKLNPHPYA